MTDKKSNFRVKTNYGNKLFADCLLNVIKASSDKIAG